MIKSLQGLVQTLVPLGNPIVDHHFPPLKLQVCPYAILGQTHTHTYIYIMCIYIYYMCIYIYISPRFVVKKPCSCRLIYTCFVDTPHLPHFSCWSSVKYPSLGSPDRLTNLFCRGLPYLKYSQLDWKSPKITINLPVSKSHYFCSHPFSVDPSIFIFFVFGLNIICSNNDPSGF